MRWSSAAAAKRIVRHRRSYEREELIFDPLHYLVLLERKTNALDQAAPLAGWQLSEEFVRLRRLLEARLGKPGKREYVQVPRARPASPWLGLVACQGGYRVRFTTAAALVNELAEARERATLAEVSKATRQAKIC